MHDQYKGSVLKRDSAVDFPGGMLSLQSAGLKGSQVC